MGAHPVDTEANRAAVLLALENAPTFLAACEQAGVKFSTFKSWRQKDEKFNEAVLEARDVRREKLRGMVEERAMEGYLRPVIYKGEMMYKRYPPGHELANQVMLDDDLEPIPLMEHVMSDQVFLRHAEANLPEYRNKGGGGSIEVLTDAPGGGKTEVRVNFVEPPDWDNVEWGEDGRPVLDDPLES